MNAKRTNKAERNETNRGLLTIERTSEKDAPSGKSQIVVNVHSTIVDRYEGTSRTEAIWSDETNLRVLTNAASDSVVREECARFFLTRAIGPVLVDLIAVRTVRPTETVITKGKLFNAIGTKVSSNAANVIMELLVPYLTKVGILSTSGSYAIRVDYPFQPVTVEVMAHDVAMMEIVRVLEGIKVLNIADKKYSKEVFAEMIGNDLYDIGRKFLDVNSIGSIVDDIVKGVRARIDTALDGFTGTIDASWRDSDVVSTLASNWTFVEAALSLPRGKIGCTNEGWKLSQHGPSVLAAIKSSQRYAVVGKSEVSRDIGTRKIRNNRGVPVSVVLWRSAVPDAVGMPVYAYEDADLAGAFTLTLPKEHIGEVVASAYGNVNGLGTDSVAAMLASMLTDAIESGWGKSQLMYQIDLGAYQFVPQPTLVALLSERVTVELDDNGNVIRCASATSGGVDRIKMWYTVATNEKDLSWGLSGRFDGSTYLTCSEAEAFLVMNDLTPTGKVEAKPQLYTGAAFNSKIVNFDEESLCPLERRFGFSVNVYNTKVHGSIRPGDLGTMKVNKLISLVVPTYNRAVFDAVSEAFDTMRDIAKQMAATTVADDPEYNGGVALAEMLARGIARKLLHYSRNISPAFRSEIHRGMVSKSLSEMTMDQSIQMRARLAQKAFGAYADVYALSTFMKMQGICTTENSFWHDIVCDQEMAKAYFEEESDRPALS